MKIVKFNDGSYGIRKWSLLHLQYVYLDLNNRNYWWSLGSRWIKDCKGSLEEVQSLTDKGKPL